MIHRIPGWVMPVLVLLTLALWWQGGWWPTAHWGLALLGPLVALGVSDP